MHLFAARPGGFVDDEGIIDLAQTAGDLVVLSAADSSLSALARAVEDLPDDFPSVRLANWMNLVKPAAFDLYQDKVLDQARVAVVSLLGGSSYWQYGHQQLLDWAAADRRRTLILVPGCDAPDDELIADSTVDTDTAHQVWRYLRLGGAGNASQLLHYLSDQCLERPATWQPPRSLPDCILYRAGGGEQTLDDWRHQYATTDRPPCLLLFYRSHFQGANTTVVDSLLQALHDEGLAPLAVAVTSLKEDDCRAAVNRLLAEIGATLVLNTTSFAINRVPARELGSTAGEDDAMLHGQPVVLQVIMASSALDDWQAQPGGLRSRDMAMQVVLPEMDGRIITRAVGFKTEDHYSVRGQTSVIRHEPHAERIAFVATLARRFCALRRKPNAHKRLALVLANYPTSDGRLGNGVGLDTPASTVQILQALEQAGYPLQEVPADSDALMEALQGAVTNSPASQALRPCWQSLDMADYRHWFDQLPEANRQAVLERWGDPAQDPACRNGRLMIAGVRIGETFVGIQPARGFNMDLATTYHDPLLVPPHSYLAFYFWLRHCYEVDAIIHVGKHGNLEWLPGKGTAMSETCWPDIALGPLPHFYPFIVNDPGEGAQAKRRSQAVIIDHLMPPLTRADSYGALSKLEGLVDEFYQASGMDRKREDWLRQAILQQLRDTGIDRELTGIENPTEADEATLLNELDAYLCDIKEAQIRNGLHILGTLPDEERLADTLVALLRLPRGSEPEHRGLLHNLTDDVGLRDTQPDFDPLTAGAEPWQGARPAALTALAAGPWRTSADTRERLELLARELILSHVLGDGDIDQLAERLPLTARLCRYAREAVMPALHQSAHLEIHSLLGGLAGRFVPPGPSGAPSRGRLDTLPTGRNFYTVDSRAIPSPAAWALGQKSARELIERHLQDHGDFPERLGLSVWGTATMRTGGDDIAQALALMGVRPLWAEGSNRVIDVEVVPGMQLDYPRVDVTLRVSGFFRDAFPNVIRLFDMAVQALADYDEPGSGNRIRAHVQSRIEELVSDGMPAEEAQRQASYRVFGSAPGAYGTGLSPVLNGGRWETGDELAEAWLRAGSYAYGQTSGDAVSARDDLEHQLARLDAVVQNQDNREHDILDSGTYYQFQGGMANATRALKGDLPAIYHADHANPAAPRIRTLKEELNRVVRSRVLNPKWINAMREHGYKGAFEMAATVDALFAYDATVQVVDDHQYQQVTDALVLDPHNQAFMRQHNPQALEDMAERLLEAVQRGQWEQPDPATEAELRDLLLALDEQTEGMQP